MAESFVQVNSGSGPKLHSNIRTIGANSVDDEVVVLGEQYLAEYRVQTATTSIATSAAHVLQVMAGASLNVYVRRIHIFQSVVATAANFAQFDLYRLTTAGTGGTSVTARPLDSTAAAAGATGMTLPTAKGTEGVLIETAQAYVLQTVSASLGVPQSTLIAEFTFDGPRGQALRIPAGTANGIAVKIVTGVAACQVFVTAEIVEANF